MIDCKIVWLPSNLQRNVANSKVMQYGARSIHLISLVRALRLSEKKKKKEKKKTKHGKVKGALYM